MNNKELANIIDHTLLKADATQAEIIKLCAEAKEFNFASVCVNPTIVYSPIGHLFVSPFPILN